jgi:hypothetical protein
LIIYSECQKKLVAAHAFKFHETLLMDSILLADVVVTVHLCFMLFVLISQLLIVAGWLLDWSWIRNFWFRFVHLLSIGVVAAQAVAGIECPLTTLERHLRTEGEYPMYCALLAANLVLSPSEDVLASLGSATYAVNPKSVMDEGGPYLHKLDRASAIGRFCNHTLFYTPENRIIFPIAYVSFALLVMLTWICASPRMPWRKSLRTEAAPQGSTGRA